MTQPAAIAREPGEAARIARDIEVVRSTPTLRALGADVVGDAVRAGDLRVREVWRDEIVADGEALESDGEWIYLVQSGQVVVGLFDPDILADERAWSSGVGQDERQRKIRPQGPLIHLADQHLAVFGAGDLFNSRALAADRDRYAFFAPLPARLVAARPAWLGDAAAGSAGVAAAIGDAVRVARDRLAALPGARGEILDFYVRQGLSAASTLRVVQIDRCIECRECERACAERHGISRLTIPGPRLGRVGIAVTCRTCTDRRCVSVCNFDSIEYDDKLGEVLIRENSCTGCASCANACPYGAIRMVLLADPASARFLARLERSGALKSGPEAARREPAEHIASKCDHCIGHDDQACITRCPTGALIEVAPALLFSGAHGAALEAARLPPAAIRPPPVAAPGLPLPTRPFQAGVGARRASRLAGARAALLWGIGILGLLAAAAEIVLRKLAPQLSLQYRMLLADGLEPDLARFRVGYLAGSSLSLSLAYAGSGLMLVALLFPLYKRWRPLGRLGSGGAWFDLHVMGGTIGPLYIVLHSAFHLINWVAIALWAFAAVVASGVVGRYLLTRLPDRFPGKSLSAVDHESEMARIGEAWPAALAAAQGEVARYRRFARPGGESRSGFTAALGWIAADDLRRSLAWLGRRARLARGGAPRAIRRGLRRRIARIIAAERHAALTARCAAFLRVWLRIHILFTALAVIVSLAHVVTAMTFSM